MSTYARLTRFEETVDSAVWIKWAHSDRSTFFVVVDAIRQRIPAHARAYSPTSKSWRIDTTYLNRLYDVLPELATAAHTRQETPRKAAVPWRDPVAVPPEVEAALDALYLLPGAPRQLVQQAYRALALRHHPDTGGTTEAMTAINRAYEVAQAWYDRQAGPPGDTPLTPRKRRKGAAA